MSLAAWLPTQRWFGGKGRRVIGIHALDRAAFAGADLTIAEVEYENAASDRYFVPVGEDGADALVDSGFCHALLDALASGVQLRTTDGGEIGFRGGPRSDRLPSQAEAHVRRVDAEQSNSSVVYGDALILKVFRRLQSGVNPEVDVLRFLAERTDFQQVPRLAGTIDYRRDDERYSLALLQEWVDNEGDGWNWVLDHLCHPERSGDRGAPLYSASEGPRSAVVQSCSSGTGVLRCAQDDTGVGLDSTGLLAALAELGRVTAELHLALASDSTDPAFSPRTIRRDDVNAWRAGANARLDRLLTHLAATLRDRPGSAQSLAQRAIGRSEALRAIIGHFEILADAGVAKTRVHGDYHLGQVLKTAVSWVVIDFEGEPLRPIAERRALHSPLKDVAGMLRSFNYARHAAERSGAVGADTWEVAARRAFLGAYCERARAGGARFLPGSGEAVSRALAALEVEKALYELEYELGNRPDWAEIPLRALAEELTPPSLT